MGKLTAAFYSFVVVVLGLFGCFTFLLTTVNPARLSDALSSATTTAASKAASTAAAAAENTETVAVTSTPAGLMNIRSYNAEQTGYKQVARERLDAALPQVPSNKHVVATFMENYPQRINFTDPKKSKGRRSVNQRRKENRGVVIMKLVDGDGRPRIEIVFYPKRTGNDRKIYEKNNIFASKVSKMDLLKSSILNIMPDDSIVFENKVISNKRDLETDYISEYISDETEATNMNTLSLNSINTSNHNERNTNLNTILLSEPHPTKHVFIENSNSNVSTEMRMNYSNEEQTLSNKDVSTENTDNLLHYTSTNLNTVRWNNEDNGIKKNESSKDGFDTKDPGIIFRLKSALNENSAEPDTILMSSAQNTSLIESSDTNDTMEMDFDEKVQRKSHDYVYVKNTDNLLQSTSPDFNIIRGDKGDIEIDTTETNTEVVDAKNDGLNLGETSSVNERSKDDNVNVMMKITEKE